VAPVRRPEPPPRPHAAVNPRPDRLHREQEQQALLVRAKTSCGRSGQPTPWAGPAPPSSAACRDIVASLLAGQSPCPTPLHEQQRPHGDHDVLLPKVQDDLIYDCAIERK
jgi:hypothetical protein